jgi:NADPH:quinone reductase-like Zn-dependent oxidoreductase
VFAVDPGPGDTVVISGAAGGVGSLAVQLARRRSATVIGLASEPNHAWLTALGVVPVEYGNGMAERIRRASGGNVDAFIDTFGGGYGELAVELGVRPGRINTIRDWQDAEVQIARTYPLEQVRDAFRELERRHTHGKIVLRP